MVIFFVTKKFFSNKGKLKNQSTEMLGKGRWIMAHAQDLLKSYQHEKPEFYLCMDCSKLHHSPTCEKENCLHCQDRTHCLELLESKNIKNHGKCDECLVRPPVTSDNFIKHAIAV